MIPLGSLVNAAGGALFMALGAWVVSLRPRSRTTVALAVFCVGFGGAFTFQNLWDYAPGMDAWNQTMAGLSGLFAIPAAAALLVIGARFPRGHRASRRQVGAALALAGVGALPWLSQTATRPASYVTAQATLVPGEWPILHGGILVLQTAIWTTVVLLGLRFPEAASGTERRGIATMAAALVLFPGFLGGAALLRGVSEFGFGISIVLWAGVAAAAWLAATRRAGSPTARNIALLTLAAPLAGMIASAAAGGFLALDRTGVFGLARAATVLLLAYAILRHQLLGLEVKLKWTLKQSTVAAAFIGVFFVVSESAARFFEGSVGPYLGILAAGALVFAIAPLQRVAERVASAAMPGVKAPFEMTPSERLDAYRDLARTAWADGQLSADERRMLETARERLGLTREQAHEAESAAVARP